VAEPQHRQEAWRRRPGLELHRRAARPEADEAAGPGVQVLEHRRLPFEVQVVGRRVRVAASAVALRPHHHQPIGVAIRQRREERRMDDAEDRRRRRDPERQGQDRDGGETRVLQQQPQAEAHVAQQVSHREPREGGPSPWRPET
jgi:hypothetical protein